MVHRVRIGRDHGAFHQDDALVFSVGSSQTRQWAADGTGQNEGAHRSSSSSSSSRFRRGASRWAFEYIETASPALYMLSYSCVAASKRQRRSHTQIQRAANACATWIVARRGTGDGAHLHLGEEAGIGGDAVPAVLDHVQRVLPGHLALLHHVHDHERGREADAACAWACRGPRSGPEAAREMPETHGAEREGGAARWDGGDGEAMRRCDEMRWRDWGWAREWEGVGGREACLPLQWTRTRPPCASAALMNSRALRGAQTRGFGQRVTGAEEKGAKGGRGHTSERGG